MKRENYFSEDVDQDTWEDFLILEHQGDLYQSYEKITGYGWSDKFSLNINGKALYINEHGDKYKGVWFDIGDRRISVFAKNSILRIC